MPQLPPAVWAAVAAAALLLLALLGATAYAVLRRPARSRVARLPAGHVVALFGLAAIPWLVAWLAPITIRVSIHSLGPLLGWLAVALLVYLLLVAVPLAVVLTAAVWLVARCRAATAPAAAPSPTTAADS